MKHRIGDLVIGPVIRLLERLIPARRGLVVIASGGRFDGNPAALMEDWSRRPDLVPMWLCSDANVRRELIGRFPGHVLRTHSLRTAWTCLRAQALMTSHKLPSLGPYGRYRERCAIVYLTHGVPMKTMSLGDSHPRRPEALHRARFTHAIGCGPLDRELWARQYEMLPDRIWITGYPRHAPLFRPIDRPAGLPPGPIILYAPTYRRRGEAAGLLRVPGGEELARLDEVLERHGAHLFVRPHYFEDFDGHVSARIHDGTGFPDATALLAYVDILVTDYSSIYIDHLLLDRPQIFLPYDRREYLAGRGIQFDYDQHTPGDKVSDIDGLAAALDRTLGGVDDHRDDRRRVRLEFHVHRDARAADRIAEHLFRDAGVRPA